MRAYIASLPLLCCMPIAALAQSARQEKVLNLPNKVSVEAVSVAPVGNLIAAICSDHVVRVWSTRSAELLRSLDENGKPPSAMQFSAEGHLLAVAYEIIQYEKGAIKVFDVHSWKVLHDLASSYIGALTFSPDSGRLASAGDFDLDVWDLTTHKKLATMSPPFGGSAALSFSPDGRLVAAAGGDGFVRVYDANTGALRGTPAEFLLEHFAVAFSPDGKSILTGGADKAISIIDVESGKVTRMLPKQSGLVSSLDVSADGKQAAVVYRSSESFAEANHMILWDLVRETVLADFQKPGLVMTGGGFVGDHYVLATTSGNQLALWSIP